MGQRLSSDYAAKKDVLNKLRKEECASGMEEREFVGAKDVQIMPSKEECV